MKMVSQRRDKSEMILLVNIRKLDFSAWWLVVVLIDVSYTRRYRVSEEGKGVNVDTAASSTKYHSPFSRFFQKFQSLCVGERILARSKAEEFRKKKKRIKKGRGRGKKAQPRTNRSE